MYHQIARNKRNSIIVIVCFLVVWLLAGFVIGEFGCGGTTSARRRGDRPRHARHLRRALRLLLRLRPPCCRRWARRRRTRGQFQQLYNIVQTLAIGDGLPAAEGLHHRRPEPQRLRDGPRPAARRRHRDDRAAPDDESRGARGRARPRDEPHQELRRAAAPGRHDDDRDGGAHRERRLERRVPDSEPRQRGRCS